ncbi:hypothetical protein BJ085DRAFT_5291, partial [Dimargaris cristalligena]
TFSCASCNRSYSRKQELNRHLKSFTKERPFACTNCARAFNRKDILKRHINTIH